MGVHKGCPFPTRPLYYGHLREWIFGGRKCQIWHRYKAEQKKNRVSTNLTDPILRQSRFFLDFCLEHLEVHAYKPTVHKHRCAQKNKIKSLLTDPKFFGLVSGNAKFILLSLRMIPKTNLFHVGRGGGAPYSYIACNNSPNCKYEGGQLYTRATFCQPHFSRFLLQILHQKTFPESSLIPQASLIPVELYLILSSLLVFQFTSLLWTYRYCSLLSVIRIWDI